MGYIVTWPILQSWEISSGRYVCYTKNMGWDKQTLGSAWMLPAKFWLKSCNNLLLILLERLFSAGRKNLGSKCVI